MAGHRWTHAALIAGAVILLYGLGVMLAPSRPIATASAATGLGPVLLAALLVIGGSRIGSRLSGGHRQARLAEIDAALAASAGGQGPGPHPASAGAPLQSLARPVHGGDTIARTEEAKVEVRNVRRDSADHAQEGRARRRHRRRRRASPPRSPAEDDGSTHRGCRPPRGDQGTGEPGGLVTGAPLVRPAESASIDAGTFDVAPEDLPRHVAIIMDGNRRWAREAGLSEAEGHAAGVEAIRPIIRHAVRRGVGALSLFAFSSENWSRSPEEVGVLLGLLDSAIRDETPSSRPRASASVCSAGSRSCRLIPAPRSPKRSPRPKAAIG